MYSNRTIVPARTFGRRWFAFMLLGFWGFFCFASILTAFQSDVRFGSRAFQQYIDPLANGGLMHVLSMENEYFRSAAPVPPPNLRSLALQSISTLQPEDHRSLLGKELPGFKAFDGEVLVAGEGTDYTSLPMESPPPLEVLLQERQAAADALKQDNDESSAPPPSQTTGDRDVVFVYHTHARESFLPMLPDVTEPNEAYHTEANITLVGEKLGKELEKRGIGTSVNKHDVTEAILANGETHAASYDYSKSIVQEAMAGNEDLTFFFDLHRDALRKDKTTVTINGETYARVFFVIGGKHARYEENLQLAKNINDRLEEQYPGLSRGIMTKTGPGTNGKFNQDLSPNAILIEFGGVDNTKDELFRTAEVIAEVFASTYWEVEKVSTEGG
ncbi:stage II sporulation protein P [Bacillaceae bacterium SIJ1]|uniref:stage II sporulation protein P n=1 Tax=Litoribacterium kuwaitense TaxID=1398745 RepID=UPI0013EA0773|nr:stage II sporulation protein P [Litoribacterium kuwaitense]NGP43501.1 stage II sporulation protein P [Litoribacterium kuwaitense]